MCLDVVAKRGQKHSNTDGALVDVPGLHEVNQTSGISKNCTLFGAAANVGLKGF